jgi:hypothetical protein
VRAGEQIAPFRRLGGLENVVPMARADRQANMSVGGAGG